MDAFAQDSVDCRFQRVNEQVDALPVFFIYVRVHEVLLRVVHLKLNVRHPSRQIQVRPHFKLYLHCHIGVNQCRNLFWVVRVPNTDFTVELDLGVVGLDRDGGSCSDRLHLEFHSYHLRLKETPPAVLILNAVEEGICTRRRKFIIYELDQVFVMQYPQCRSNTLFRYVHLNGLGFT